MPPAHRNFIAAIEEAPSIRTYGECTSTTISVFSINDIGTITTQAWDNHNLTDKHNRILIIKYTKGCRSENLLASPIWVQSRLSDCRRSET